MQSKRVISTKLSLLKPYIQIYSLTIIFIVLTICISVYQNTEINVEKLGYILIGWISIIFQIHIIKLSSFKYKMLTIILSLLFIIIYTILYIYKIKQGVSLDYRLIYENFSLLFYKESIVSIFSAISIYHIIYLFLSLLILYFLNKKFYILSEIPLRRTTPFIFIFILLMNVLLITFSKKDTNVLTDFIQSIQYFYADKIVATDTKLYPYINTNVISHKFERLTKNPHIFLIFMESYNGLYTDKKSKNGKIITPFFNQLKKDGLFMKNFYGHSIQTAKGQFGTLSGILPSVYSKVFTTFPNLNLHALPSVLNEYGYTTVFTKAYKSLEFDNTRSYAEKLGFSYIESLGTKKHLNKDDKGKIWGWGLQDDRYYHKFFNFIDTIHTTAKNKPIFATLTTVSNHMMFNKIPKDQQYIYPKANNNYENFMNSMHLADKYLETFFIELKKRKYLDNSIIIITGDHSYPNGKHKYWHNEASYYEEFFKIPLLIIGKNYIKPTENNITASQIDIAPTILDMLNIQTKNHFIGKSIFLRKKEEPIYLVQPYSGSYIVTQHNKMKYIKHLRTGSEYLYDLYKDENETTNLIFNKKYTTLVNTFRNKSNMLLQNNQLIKENRIWPPSKEKKEKQEIQNNFTLTVKQQYNKLRNLNSPTNEARVQKFNIDIVNFLNKRELIHATLGGLDFVNNFFTEIIGNFNVEVADTYDIYIASDDGFRLFIDNNKIAEYIENRPLRGKTYQIYLNKGKHFFKLKHYQGVGKVGLQMKYKRILDSNYRFFGENSKNIKFRTFKPKK